MYSPLVLVRVQRRVFPKQCDASETAIGQYCILFKLLPFGLDVSMVTMLLCMHITFHPITIYAQRSSLFHPIMPSIL